MKPTRTEPFKNSQPRIDTTAEKFIENYSYNFPIMVCSSTKEDLDYYCYVLNLPMAFSHGKTKEGAIENMRLVLHDCVQIYLIKKEELPWITWHKVPTLEYLWVLGGKHKKRDTEWIKRDVEARQREKTDLFNSKLDEEWENSKTDIIGRRLAYSQEIPEKIFRQLNKNLSKKVNLFSPKGKKLFWYLKQLFPLTYRSHYSDVVGDRHFAVWKMWFGKVYQYEDMIIEGSPPE